MTGNIDLINIDEFAKMKRCSQSLIRHQLTERRRGRDGDGIPMPITTRPKQRLYWLREECVRYIERLNAAANHQSPQPCTQLSGETMRLANQFGLDGTSPQSNSQKKGGQR